MLPLSQRVAFCIFAALTLWFGARGFYRLYRRIARGRPDPDRRRDHLLRRAWYALSTTLTQERVFRRRPVLSVFHAFIFYAFVLYLLVNLLDAVHGFVNLGTFLPAWIDGPYRALTDLFSVLAIVGVLAFLLRRFLAPSRRDFLFNPRTLLQPAVGNGYIQRDSLIVSAFILFHVGSRIVGNAALLAREGPDRLQPFSSRLALLFRGPHVMFWRVFGYWGALGSVLLFLLYFPYSKHLHLLMAPLNYLFRRDASSGELPPVILDLEAADPQIGAAHLADLSWARLLDAYACIQCNRCQDVCPASQTGKALSPAALEINKRMALNAIATEVSAFAPAGSASFERGAAAGPDLLRAVLSPEAVWGCTTCGACMQVCPTQDEQMLDIIDMRRNLVMLQGEFPAPLQTAFRGMERTGNPWGMARDKRLAWAESLDVPTLDEVPDPDVLYWVGCAASYDPSAGKTARAVVQLLQQAGVRFAVLGKRESCTGDTARRAGNELLYQQLATAAIATLQEARPRLVLASCPHCVNTIAAEYPQFGGHFEVMHHTEYLASLVQEGRLTAASDGARVTFHDPCYLGRHRGVYAQPRSLLKVLTDDFVELRRKEENAFCCGAGGAQFWKEEEKGDERVSENRFREAQQTLSSASGGKVLAVGCPFCKSMLQSSPAAAADESIQVKDVAELLWEGVQRAQGLTPALSHASHLQSTAQATLLDAASTPPGRHDPAAPAAPPSPAPAVETSSAATPSPAPTVAPEPEVTTTPRRKWAPKSAAETQVSTVRAEPAPPVPSTPAAGTPGAAAASAEPAARRKWAPKTTAPAPASVPPEPSTPASTPPAPRPVAAEAPASDTPTPPTTRKKWQPGGPR